MANCVLTEKETEELNRINAENGWGIDLDELSDLIHQHENARKNGDEKIMAKIEYRLTDINFHTECGLLSRGEYDKALKTLEDW